MNTKPKYEAPSLSEIGSFEEITQTINVGNVYLDANYTTGQKPTFS